MTNRNAPFSGEPAPAAPLTPRTAVLRAWVAEWEWWTRQPATVEAVDRWRRRHRCLEPFTTPDSLVDACGRDRTVVDRDGDLRMAALVQQVHEGDEGAVRVVLQRVLPALIARAGRRAGWQPGGFPTLFGEYTAAAWTVIATYPITRRPTKIAINVVMEAEHHLFGRRPLIERLTVPSAHPADVGDPAELDGRPPHAAQDPLIEVLELLADSRRLGLPAAEVGLLADIALGRSAGELARRAGVSTRTIRTRRRQAISELARVQGLPEPPARSRRAVAA